MENYVVSQSRLLFKQWFYKTPACFSKEILIDVSLDCSAKTTPSCDCSVIATLLSGKTEAGRQDCKNIFSSRQVHKAGLLFLPQRSYVREISSRFVQHTISRAWTPHAIFLSDRNDPLWECWYNLSNLTNQRVYQELVYRNGSFKEMITGSAAPSLPSFLPFYFRLRAL